MAEVVVTDSRPNLATLNTPSPPALTIAIANVCC